MNLHEQAIVEIAQNSSVNDCWFDGRGLPPKGFTKGMALSFARLIVRLRAGDAAAVEAAKGIGTEDRDALAYYDDRFKDRGLSNDAPGEQTLLNSFMMLFGLGMQESSGKYCDGMDRSASNDDAETCEAGLFQLSYNSRKGSPLLPDMIERYRGSTDLANVFVEGVHCTSEMWENHGKGPGRYFQELTKSCPAFAVEYAAVALRTVRRQWGTIGNGHVELKPEARNLFIQVLAYLDQQQPSREQLHETAGLAQAVVDDEIIGALDQLMIIRLNQLIAAASREGISLKATSGNRDPWKQARLWRRSRTKAEVQEKISELREKGADYLAQILEAVGPQATGSWRTNAVPGLSWHQHRKAVDFGIVSPRTGNVLVGGRDEDGDEFRYAEQCFARMGVLCSSFGLTWGGTFKKSPDENHVQLPKAGSPLEEMSISEINEAMRLMWPNQV